MEIPPVGYYQVSNFNIARNLTTAQFKKLVDDEVPHNSTTHKLLCTRINRSLIKYRQSQENDFQNIIS